MLFVEAGGGHPVERTWLTLTTLRESTDSLARRGCLLVLMLLDELMPVFDATRIEHRVIGGSCAEVYEAALRADFRRAFSESTAARLLVGARTAAERLVAAVRPGVSAPTEDSGEAMTLAGLEGHGQYILLGVDRPHEIVFGMIGRFWGGETRWEQIDASEFGSFDHPGLARIACNFSLRPYGEARTLVSYETRTHATDAASQRSFRRYWRVASPLAGVVLRAQLAVVAREAATRTAARVPC